MITGLNEQEYKEVCRILKDYSQDYFFYFYGSRVKGKFSDLDVYVVAINGGDYGILDKLQDIFDDNMKVLCKVNFTRDDYIKDDFRTRIKIGQK